MLKKIEKIEVKTLTKCIAFSILVILLYTVFEFIISTVTGIHHEVLTDKLYMFFGTELVSCMLIKICKILKINKKEDDE